MPLTVSIALFLSSPPSPRYQIVDASQTQGAGGVLAQFEWSAVKRWVTADKRSTKGPAECVDVQFEDAKQGGAKVEMRLRLKDRHAAASLCDSIGQFAGGAAKMVRFSTPNFPCHSPVRHTDERTTDTTSM